MEQQKIPMPLFQKELNEKDRLEKMRLEKFTTGEFGSMIENGGSAGNTKWSNNRNETQ